MEKNKQTSAVDYIIDELINELYYDRDVSVEKRDRVLSSVHQARQLFKEQILHAATYGANAESPEKYYESRY